MANDKHIKNAVNQQSRRNFVKQTLTAAAGFTILPSFVVSGLGHKSPSDKLNVAVVGLGVSGRINVQNIKEENIVALCDIDWKFANESFNEFPKAKKYFDYRKMLDEMQDTIDAVVIATPDHSHAIIANAAMQLGKHVFVQTPLTHSVHEARVLHKTAIQYKVATQMGNQYASNENVSQICEWIWDGAIGEIEEVHAWTNYPLWPQCLERPNEKMSPRDNLKWDLFLGPAKNRPFHSIYTPFGWRAWWDFGNGALGIMGCNILEPVFRALKLKHVDSVEACSSQFNTESPPLASKIIYNFAKRDNLPKLIMPKVKVIWYDGGFLPERPIELPDNEILGRDKNGGVLFIGSKGKLMCGANGHSPILLPYKSMRDYQKPSKTLRRVLVTKEQDWIRACKEMPENRIETTSNFDYSALFTEMILLGNVAIRLQDVKKTLLWDAEKMKISNLSDSDKIRVVESDSFSIIEGRPEAGIKKITIDAKLAAEEYIKHSYRKGWVL